MRLLNAFCLAVLCTFAATAEAAECTAQSGERRVALLELYTSEGCDSCPPTDRWVSDLPRRGFGTDRVVVLAYHVDYWDRLGWPDRFAQSRFSDRQRVANSRNGTKFVYTPQLMLNARDYRRAPLRDEFAEALSRSSAAPAKAQLKVTAIAAGTEVEISGVATLADARNDAQLWLALYENGLSTAVRAGENRGKELKHDFVVRELAGPFATGAFKHATKLKPDWKRANLGIAAFVTDARSGEPLQALALPLCR